MSDISDMGFSSSIAQRTRARKLQHFLEMLKKRPGSSNHGEANQRNNSEEVARISHVDKEINAKKRKSGKMKSPASGRTVIRAKRRKTNRENKKGLENHSEDDEDNIKLLDEVFVGDKSNQVKDNVNGEKIHDVIIIEECLSNEVEGEENDTKRDHFGHLKKISITKAHPSTSRKEDGLENHSEDDEDDIKLVDEVFVGDRINQVEDEVNGEKIYDVINIDNSLSNEVEGEENDTTKDHFGHKKKQKISMTKAHPSTSPKEDGLDEEDQSLTVTADGIVNCASEQEAESIRQKDGLNGEDQSLTVTVDGTVKCASEREVESIRLENGLDGEDQSLTVTVDGTVKCASEHEVESIWQKNGLDGEDQSLTVTVEGTIKCEGEHEAESICRQEDGLDVEDQSLNVTFDGIVKNASEDEAESIRQKDGLHDRDQSLMIAAEGIVKCATEDSAESIRQEVVSRDSRDAEKNHSSDGHFYKEQYNSSDELRGKKKEQKKTEGGTSSYYVYKRRSMKYDGKETNTGMRNDSVYKKGGSKHRSKDKSFNRNGLKKMEGGSSRKKGSIAQESIHEVSANKVILEADEGENVDLGNKGVDETDNMEEESSVKGCDLLNSSRIKPLHTEANESNHAKGVAGNKPKAGAQIKESVTKIISPILMRKQTDQPSTCAGEGRNKSPLKNGRNKSPLNNLSEMLSEKVCRKEEGSEWFTKIRQVRGKKDKDFFKVLANAILRDEEVPKEAPSQQEVQPEAQQSPSLGYSLPSKFRFEDEETKVPEKSDYDNMVAGLFADLKNNWTYDFTFDFSKVGHTRGIPSWSEATELYPCSEGKHDLVRNDQIGDICRRCHCVVNEIRDIYPEFAKNVRQNSRKSFSQKENFSVPDDFDVSIMTENLKESCMRTEGTVWSIVPGVRESMYKHQQDGFEFLWKNLAGTTDLAELKNADPKDVGGCIISHAPGTGKTRLSIVFVQSYLRLFPDSRPVIIAPASMLLTWEEEFKKWEVEFPFHNLCNPEFSGKETKDLLRLLSASRDQDNKKVRWVKIYTWRKEKSILGISYNLYEKLAGEKVAADEESESLKRILLQLPQLVILDEGHIPRNQSSSIWRTLLKLQTEKRVILSGTPFQNNFDELFNTLHLVRSGILEKEKAFAGMVSSKRRYSRKRAGKECIHDSRTKQVDKEIEKLQCIMQPFVHVHKGSILQKSLPGLTDCVILLEPQPLQKSLIEKLEFSRNTFEDGYKVALLSAHPSLAEHCWSSEYENSEVNQEILKVLRLDYEVGTKTKFIMALIQFSTAMNEKVLIFSQYIHPLELIKDQIKANFDWHEGKEILQMQGKQDQLQRQSIITIFNNPNSGAKVLLAATRCSSEGISLVGASRVVLLDVVWNPSVERQAISRAYRLGQKKIVYTYHLITSGTNEGDKYCRQIEKDRLSELVFSSAPKENDEPRVPTTTFEDGILNKMVNHAELKEMFLKIVSTPKETNLVETFGLLSPA